MWFSYVHLENLIIKSTVSNNNVIKIVTSFNSQFWGLCRHGHNGGENTWTPFRILPITDLRWEFFCIQDQERNCRSNGMWIPDLLKSCVAGLRTATVTRAQQPSRRLKRPGWKGWWETNSLGHFLTVLRIAVINLKILKLNRSYFMPQLMYYSFILHIDFWWTPENKDKYCWFFFSLVPIHFLTF